MTNRERDIQINFRVTEQERDLIYKNMHESDIKNLGAYLRKMAIDGRIFKLDNSPLKEMSISMSRFSSNLNQIAKRVNSTDTIYTEDIQEMKEMMVKIWQSQKYILSKLP